MKRLWPNHLRLLGVLCCASWVAGLKSSAQTPPTLGVQYIDGHPALTIAGDAGALYSIQYTPVMSPTNVWTGLTLLQLQLTNHAWIDPTASLTSQRFYRAVSIPAPPNTNLSLSSRFIPNGQPNNRIGSFRRRRPPDKSRHQFGFWIGASPVTQAEYQGLIGVNPSYFNTNNGFSPNMTRPVEQVSWDDASNYCAKLTQQEQRQVRFRPTMPGTASQLN